MNKMVSSKGLSYVALVVLAALLGSCGLLGIGGNKGGDNGELVGVINARQRKVLATLF